MTATFRNLCVRLLYSRTLKLHKSTLLGESTKSNVHKNYSAILWTEAGSQTAERFLCFDCGPLTYNTMWCVRPVPLLTSRGQCPSTLKVEAACFSEVLVTPTRFLSRKGLQSKYTYTCVRIANPGLFLWTKR